MLDSIKSGEHLGVVRNWIKWRARNGEHVTWGSREYLDLSGVTVHDMERLAQDIANAVLSEETRLDELEELVHKFNAKQPVEIRFRFRDHVSQVTLWDRKKGMSIERSLEYMGFSGALNWLKRKITERLESDAP